MKVLLYGDMSLSWISDWADVFSEFDNIPFTTSPSLIEYHNYSLVITQGMRFPSDAVARTCAALGIPFITQDLAHIDRERYRQVGPYLGAIPDGPLPRDRLDAVLRGRSPLPYREGSTILIAGQKPDDANHGLCIQELSRLYLEIVAIAKQWQHREVVFRPHPRDKAIRIPGIRNDTGPLAESLAEAHVLITYNSTTAVDAALDGVPTCVLGRSPVSELSMRNIREAVRAPRYPSELLRTNVLSRIAYSQWTPDEIRSGRVLNFLRSQLQC